MFNMDNIVMRPCCEGGVPSFGPSSSPVWIVGIQPGKDEIKSGRPFTGPNGKLLSAILESIGLDIDSYYLTNYLCGPNCNSGKASIRFANEISALGPRLIITLGATACEQILGQKLGSTRGQMLLRDGIYYMPTVQPIAALQGGGPSVGSDLIRDFRKIDSILNFVPKEMGYKVVAFKEEAQYILDNLPKDEPVAIDIETMEVPDDLDQEDAWDHQLECLAISNDKFAYVFPASVCQGLTWPQDVQWLGHNAWSFDRAGIERYLGVRLDIHWDTLLAAYALDERRLSSIKGPLLKLKPLCREYVGADNWEEGKKGDVYKYNAADAIYTRRLHDVLVPMLHADDTYNLYRDLLIPEARVLSDAQIYGCKININELARMIVEWVPRLAGYDMALKDLAHECGWPTKDINCNSPKQLSKFLFECLELPIQKYTKAGQASTDKETLNELDHEFVTRLLEFKQLDKVISSYLFSANKHLKYDGRLHPKPLLHGTVTGRPSYTDPAVQTIPQEHTVGSLAELRRMFVSSSDEYVIMEADYAQLDIWMGASLSGDQTLIDDLSTPYWSNGSADYHSRVTETILKCDRSNHDYSYGTPQRTLWENRRFAAKKVTFGIMFMEGPPGLANKHTGIGCSLHEAASYIKQWYARYPDFHRWQRAIIQQAHTDGELVSIFGRKRRFPLILDHRSDRQAGNFPIQSAESDCTMTSAIELHPQLLALDSHILFLVHDSIVMEVAKKHFWEVTHTVRHTMQKPRAPGLLSVPVEIKAGSNWYDVMTVPQQEKYNDS